METIAAELKYFLDKPEVNDPDPDRISYLNPSSHHHMLQHTD